MAGGEVSFAGYFVGLAGAVAAFIVNDRITQVLAGIRFRRRLAADIQVVVEGYYNHLPDLSRIIDQAEKTLNGSKAPLQLEWTPSPIWENDYNLLDHVYQHSSHLRLTELKECVNFYDTLGRLFEIRRAYNSAAQDAAVRVNEKEQYTRYAFKRLDDLRYDYVEVIRRGCSALLELSKRHWFLQIDRERYDGIMANYDEPASPHSDVGLGPLLHGEQILLASSAGYGHYWCIAPGEVSDFRVRNTTYDRDLKTYDSQVAFRAQHDGRGLSVTGHLRYTSLGGVLQLRSFEAISIERIGDW